MLKGREGDTVAGLEAFAKAREASVTGELAGTSKGKPAWNLFGANERTPRGAWVRDALSETGGFDATRASFDRAAIDAAITTSFATLDADGSESVQAKELADVLRRRWKTARRRRRADPSDDRARIAMSSIDHNGDGKITASEWKAGVAALTRFWDRNVDQLWSRQELNVPSK